MKQICFYVESVKYDFTSLVFSKKKNLVFGEPK